MEWSQASWHTPKPQHLRDQSERRGTARPSKASPGFRRSSRPTWDTEWHCVKWEDSLYSKLSPNGECRQDSCMHAHQWNNKNTDHRAPHFRQKQFNRGELTWASSAAPRQGREENGSGVTSHNTCTLGHLHGCGPSPLTYVVCIGHIPLHTALTVVLRTECSMLRP